MKKIFVVILLVFVSVSCKKYDNGGLVSRSDKNLTRQTWKLDQYLRNGNDETDQLLISNYEETYAEGGELTRTYSFGGQNISEVGSWQLKNDTKQIKVDGVSSLELTPQTSTVSTSDIEILRLKKKEFWYYFENGSDRHEFHFIPK